MECPACSVCGVEYSEDYEGPCQEWAPSATNAQISRGDAPMCPGTVSLAATLQRRVTALADLLGEALNLIEHEPSIDCTGSAKDIIKRGRAALADTERRA